MRDKLLKLDNSQVIDLYISTLKDIDSVLNILKSSSVEDNSKSYELEDSIESAVKILTNRKRKHSTTLWNL